MVICSRRKSASSSKLVLGLYFLCLVATILLSAVSALAQVSFTRIEPPEDRSYILVPREVSAEGNVVVGYYHEGLGEDLPFKWTLEDGRVDLPTLGRGGVAYAVSESADSVFGTVGFERPPGYTSYFPAFWKQGQLFSLEVGYGPDCIR
jgi:hypothetical protein